jgi:ketosteroid isomerase-like protein
LMAAADVDVAERFRVALEGAVRTGDREAVYELLAPDVTWVIPQRTLRGLDEMRQDWSWGSAPETFDYEFEEGGWVDVGDERVACEVQEIYRMKNTGEFAYRRTVRVELTIHDGKIDRYELRVLK